MSVAAISAISPLVTTSHPPTNLLGGSGRDHFRRRSRRTYRERGNETVNGLPERGDVHADSLDLRADSVNVSHNSGKIHVVIQALNDIRELRRGIARLSVTPARGAPHGADDSVDLSRRHFSVLRVLETPRLIAVAVRVWLNADVCVRRVGRAAAVRSPHPRLYCGGKNPAVVDDILYSTVAGMPQEFSKSTRNVYPVRSLPRGTVPCADHPTTVRVVIARGSGMPRVPQRPVRCSAPVGIYGVNFSP